MVLKAFGRHHDRDDFGVRHDRQAMTLVPQVFPQIVRNDKNRYNPPRVHRLLLSRMTGCTTLLMKQEPMNVN
jgi:hypothetical protein